MESYCLLAGQPAENPSSRAPHLDDDVFRERGSRRLHRKFLRRSALARRWKDRQLRQFDSFVEHFRPPVRPGRSSQRRVDRRELPDDDQTRRSFCQIDYQLRRRFSSQM